MNADLFYPAALHGGGGENRHHPDITAAFDICRRCPTQRACLELALARREDHGIWGGTTPAERRRIATARARARDGDRAGHTTTPSQTGAA